MTIKCKQVSFEPHRDLYLKLNTNKRELTIEWMGIKTFPDDLYYSFKWTAQKNKEGKNIYQLLSNDFE